MAAVCNPELLMHGFLGRRIKVRMNPSSDLAHSGNAIVAALSREDCNPLGRRELGKKVVSWVGRGIQAMAAEIAEAERARDLAGVEERVGVGEELVRLVQPFLDRVELPEGLEDECQRARNHYPTLYDHFQRELKNSLVDLQEKGSVEEWQETDSWKLFKKRSKSGQHRSSARIKVAKKSFNGLTEEVVAGIQSKVDAFVDRYLELLSVERQAELAATQQALDGSSKKKLSSGCGDEEDHDEEEKSSSSSSSPSILHEECGALCDLVAVSSFKGLGGTEVVSFRSKNSQNRLPPTSLSPGDMVCVRVSNRQGIPATECLRGSVYKLCEDGQFIEVALPGGGRALMKLSGRSIRIDKIFDLANATTYERNCEALKQLKKVAVSKDNPAAAIAAVLFGQGEEIEKLARGKDQLEDTHSLLASTLSGASFDKSQRRAIQLGLDKSRPVAVIQGPPGTGKTNVVTEIIIQAVARGDKVLATAPTNAAVDNLVDRLSDTSLRVVRVGNPVRMSPSVVSKSLTHIVSSELVDFKRSIASDKAALRRASMRCQDGKIKAEIDKNLRRLDKSVKKKEEEIPVGVLAAAQVVLCTSIGAGDPLLRKTGLFDLAVVDEAGQAMEPSCWIGILRSSRVVLAGDACQLAPTVFSAEAVDGGLATSLMERASTSLGHSAVMNTMLQVQYRMNEAIASWASSEMYGGLVKTAPSVAKQVLSDSPQVKETWRTRAAMLLLDTRKAFGSLAMGCEECMDYLGTGSFYNDGEADIVVEHVKALIHSGVPASSIAVQSPYLAQVHLLRARLDEESLGDIVQTESIDSFQGREADAVVISMPDSLYLRITSSVCPGEIERAGSGRISGRQAEDQCGGDEVAQARRDCV
ncbi:DNA-binding protein SMUBP-2 isoform X2 [Selaginella moellendorffii]|uniref:DNA-binding protein SMUBP-2 isoform X2 n=1 Tax=Selaginella moellendorffii TaxID=88036 RepID=UPI000D1CDADC|nr:DNA-binding protein SMUBP-2 isoform X2 [Selaginella moellendorffii]|eukprot:XP_024529728.1 DNA-binding protein SMUBP-2 isoform X2 [Selaginella moellendorffii]